MARMTPEREAAYALDWDLPRDDLDPAVQLEYDRLKMERESRPQMQAAAPRKTETPRWQYLIPLVILGLAWMSWAIWSIVGVSIIGSQMNFKTLRSDLSKVQLPAGYEKVSTSESGDDCARRPCTLTEFWAWHASRVHTAADACRDIGRAMGAGLPNVESNAPDVPRGAACEYVTTLGKFFQPGLGKRQAEAFVWVKNKAKGSPGGYIVELLGAYNYIGP